VVRSRIAVTAVAGLTASLLAAAPAAAAGHAQHAGRRTCPKAESLVPAAHLTTHSLGTGVTLSSGTAKDPAGRVVIHVLRADLSNRHVAVKPLVRKLAQRSPLSQLAAHRAHLVAATNTGYFDLRTGAPAGPFISGGKPVMLSTRHERVAGIGRTGMVEAADVWLVAHLSSASVSHTVSAINELRPPSGLAVYTPAWGTRVFVDRNATTRTVVGGVIGSRPSRNAANRSGGGHSGNGVTIPARGELLVATTRSAQSWLAGLHTGGTLSSSMTIQTTAAVAFTQAYGVGIQIVAKAGHPLTGFSCDSANTATPARTSIGYAKGGHQLIMVTVDDHPGTSVHGLDEDQMSKLMVQLGVTQAYALDGSGSTELLARKPGTTTLSLRTYPADGVERPMPLGLGIYSHG
jgi:Phosphodiester glycosidase